MELLHKSLIFFPFHNIEISKLQIYLTQREFQLDLPILFDGK